MAKLETARLSGYAEFAIRGYMQKGFIANSSRADALPMQ
jgi:hypothetical protein